MQPHAFFITTARGFIHDEVALAEALRAKQIAGAGLDVWAKEPPPADHPLLQFDNVIASPTSQASRRKRAPTWASSRPNAKAHRCLRRRAAAAHRQSGGCGRPIQKRYEAAFGKRPGRGARGATRVDPATQADNASPAASAARTSSTQRSNRIQNAVREKPARTSRVACRSHRTAETGSISARDPDQTLRQRGSNSVSFSMSGQVIASPRSMAFTHEPKLDGSSGTWVITQPRTNRRGSRSTARSIRVCSRLWRYGHPGDGARRQRLHLPGTGLPGTARVTERVRPCLI